MKILLIWTEKGNSQQIKNFQDHLVKDGFKVEHSIPSPELKYNQKEIESLINKEISKIKNSDIVILNATESCASLAQKGLIAKILNKKVVVVLHEEFKKCSKEISPWVLWLSNLTLNFLEDFSKQSSFKKSLYEKLKEKKFFEEVRKTKPLKNSIYIAGPFKHQKKNDDYRTKQTDYLIKKGFVIVDPCCNKFTGDLRNHTMNKKNIKKIIVGDIKALALSETLLYNLQKSSSGSGQEALIFRMLFDRPILGVCYNRSDIWEDLILNKKYLDFKSFSINREVRKDIFSRANKFNLDLTK